MKNNKTYGGLVMARDISEERFKELCKANGFEPRGFWGYYDIGNNTSVSILNAGTKRRDQFAYLLKMKQARLHEIKPKDSPPQSGLRP